MKPAYKNLGKVRPTVDNNNWSIDNKYDLLTIVYDPSSNKSYISKKDVPANVVIDNREYWLPFGVGRFVDNAIININYLDGVSQELVTYTLEEAITRISDEDKRLGVIISFYGNEASDSHTPGWCLYQFMSDDLNDWNNVNAWNSIYYNRNKNVGWFRTESELLTIYPFPHKGDYCYIGTSLISSYVYRCYINGTWTNTQELASINIGITVGGNIRISENGTWIVDNEDTGIKAVGTGVERMTYNPSQEDGGTNILQIKLTDGTQVSFPIKNGNRGNSGIIVPDLETFLAELVNNLTTDDATKALSAAQGVILDNKISQLGQKLVETEYGEPLSLSVISGELRYDVSTQKLISAPNGHLVYYKQFPVDTIIRVQGTYTSDTRVFMAGVTEVLPAIDVAVFNPFTMAQAGDVDCVINVPAGQYLCVYYYYQTFSQPLYREVTYIEKFNALSQELDELENAQNELSQQTDKLSVSVDNIASQLTHITAIDFTRINQLKWDGQKFAVGVNGQIVSYRLCVKSIKVRVKGTLSRTDKPVYYGVSDAIPAENGTMINVLTFAEVGDFFFVIDVPAGKYICCAYNMSYTSNITYQIEENIDIKKRLNTISSCIYDDRILDTEYSVLTQQPNSIPFYKSAINAGFKALKADMRLTSDNEIVLCHDAGFTLDENGRIIAFDASNNIPISTLTYNEVKALEFAVQLDGEYVHPGTLTEFLTLCKKHRVVPYLTFRSNSIEYAQKLYSVLQQYKMVEHAIINIFPWNIMIVKTLRDVHSDWLICCTRDVAESLTESMIDEAAENGAQFLCLYTGVADSITEQLVRYASLKNVRIWVHNINNSQLAEQLMQIGVSGFQNITYAPFI